MRNLRLVVEAMTEYHSYFQVKFYVTYKYIPGAPPSFIGGEFTLMNAKKDVDGVPVPNTFKLGQVYDFDLTLVEEPREGL